MPVLVFVVIEIYITCNILLIQFQLNLSNHFWMITTQAVLRPKKSQERQVNFPRNDGIVQRVTSKY